MDSSVNVSLLLAAWSEGDETALERLLPLVEEELRRLARSRMRRENDNHTLQTTALINEAFLKLIEQKDVRWQNRAHFFSIAARLMRRILLDYARKRLRDKRGNGAVHLELNEAIYLTDEKSAALVALDEALERLAEIDPFKSRIVEMRHFGGMTVEETAEVLKVSSVTVMRHWSMAKSWLKREISNRA
jgi:RNA polymerase sigma factor (TIGR02999 family)